MNAKSQPSTQRRVLIADKMSPAVEQVFAARNIEPSVRLNLAPEALVAALKDVDGVVVRSAVKITAQILKTLPPTKRLKVIGRAGIGVDNIDTQMASELGIIVMNTPFGNAVTTAEHTLSMLLSAARLIPEASATVHQGKWQKSAFKGIELMGKTLGVVGAGNIGALVIDRALGLKMKILVYDPFLSDKQVEALGGEKVEWEVLLARSDFITFHVPLTPKTQHILDKTALTQTKPGVVIVNCSRGGIVHEGDLKTFMDNGHVRAAALDVFEEEPIAPDHPLLKTPRLVLTPHLGASTGEAQERVAIQIAEQLSDFLLTGEIRNAVNTFSLTPSEHRHTAPYVTLSSQLASFIGSMIETPVTALTITTEGTATTVKPEPIVAAILHNLFKTTIESINPINAATVIKNRGIAYDFIKSEHASVYQSLIHLDVQTEKYHYHIAGTIVGGYSHVIRLQDSVIGAELKRHHLYVINQDKSGFINSIAKLLAEHQINISSFHLAPEEHHDTPSLHQASSQKKEKTAAALITLDRAIDPKLMEAIKTLPLIIKANYVQLS